MSVNVRCNRYCHVSKSFLTSDIVKAMKSVKSKIEYDSLVLNPSWKAITLGIRKDAEKAIVCRLKDVTRI